MWQEDKYKCRRNYDELIDKLLAKWAQKTPTTYLVDCWVGLPAKRFLNYKKWRTTSGYLCGTYAATVLLAYYQDYRMPNLFLQLFEKKAIKELIQKLRKMIQPLGLPTIPIQVSGGISRFLEHNNNPISARNTIIGSWQRATKRIRKENQ